MEEFFIDHSVDLKPKDLMIGDWVCAGSTIDQIAEIAYDEQAKPYVSIAASATLFRIPFDKGIHPITLTDDVLKTIGFEYDEYAKHYKRTNYELREALENYNLFKWNDDNYSLEDHCLIKVKYIHELQHLLTLIGYKERIVL